MARWPPCFPARLRAPAGRARGGHRRTCRLPQAEHEQTAPPARAAAGTGLGSYPGPSTLTTTTGRALSAADSTGQPAARPCPSAAATSSVLARSYPGLCDLRRHAAQPIGRLIEGSVGAIVRAVPCCSLLFPAVTRRGPHLVPARPPSSLGRPAGRPARSALAEQRAQFPIRIGRLPRPIRRIGPAHHRGASPDAAATARLVPALPSTTTCPARWSGDQRSGPQWQ